jgi:hypothetical protein
MPNATDCTAEGFLPTKGPDGTVSALVSSSK